jgi:hypothetical protein
MTTPSLRLELKLQVHLINKVLTLNPPKEIKSVLLEARLKFENMIVLLIPELEEYERIYDNSEV